MGDDASAGPGSPRQPVVVEADLGGPVTWVDFGGDGPELVFVHGLGGSWANLVPAGTLLAERGWRVRAVDLVGFGATPRNGRSARVVANRLLLHRYLTEVVGVPVVLVGNSMGGMISLLQAVRAAETVRRLVLVDPALPGPWLPAGLDPRFVAGIVAVCLPYVGTRVIGRRRRRQSAAEQVEETLKVITVDPARVPQQAVELMVSVREHLRDHPDSLDAFIEAARSVLSWMVLRRDRLLAAVDRLVVPTLLVHGAGDRLVPVDWARRIAERSPRIDLHVIADAGHVPQLEWPEEFVATVDAWLRGSGADAAWATGDQARLPA